MPGSLINLSAVFFVFCFFVFFFRLPRLSRPGVGFRPGMGLNLAEIIRFKGICYKRRAKIPARKKSNAETVDEQRYLIEKQVRSLRLSQIERTTTIKRS